ncbi:MAG TPA: hypothetical protein VMX54_05945 [Vicinamibacteria bacterium]|nr:hypothetical protein [Vicinamibacteria bacterium]
MGSPLVAPCPECRQTIELAARVDLVMDNADDDTDRIRFGSWAISHLQP